MNDQLGDAPTHDRAQVEGDLLDASRAPRTPAVTDDLAPQSLVVGQPVRPRDGGGLGPHRLMSEDHPRAKRAGRAASVQQGFPERPGAAIETWDCPCC